MKKGDLYILKKRDGNRQKSLFPYFSGGEALIVSVKSETLVTPMKGRKKISVVEFLFSGKVYLETVDSFLQNAKYVGE